MGLIFLSIPMNIERGSLHMKKTVQAVKSAEFDRDDIAAFDNPAGDMLDIEDEALASVAGGCGCPGGMGSVLCTPCPPLNCGA